MFLINKEIDMATAIPFSHLMSTEAFWAMYRQKSHEPPEGVGRFDKKKDWAGPAGNPKLAEMISDSIMGVPIKKAAYRHDYGYAIGGNWFTRFLDDRQFRKECRAEVDAVHNAGDLDDDDYKLAKKFCVAYYIAVRSGGWKCYNYHRKKKEAVS
jgi:hypothetical protein